MARTALVFTPKYYDHNTGVGHPETSERLKVIIKELKKHHLLSTGGRACASEFKLVEPSLATMKDLEMVHQPEHIRLVRRTCELGGGYLDLGDTVVSQESFEVARYAVGGAVDAVKNVLSGRFKNAFALTRPPGHHAGPYYASGFCVFNNVAVAASILTKKLGFSRVLILDVDAHHGNGTQEIFYSSGKVLYISLHEDPSDFTGTGFPGETGEGKGLGLTVNIPFPFNTDDEQYLKAFDEIVVPIVEQYEPQFILASAGYDAHFGDPVARLKLSTSGYSLTFEKILDLASTLCEGRFCAVLEGGYNLAQLGKLVALTISKMAGLPYLTGNECPPRNLKAQEQAEKIIEEVKKVQSRFWSLKV
jgi:acetoin utilization deacetylase AcuC-like enzyme